MLVIKILKKQLIFCNDPKEGNKSCARDQCFSWKALARASWEMPVSAVCRILSHSSTASGGLDDLISFVGFQIYLQLNCILEFANLAPGKELINNWRAQSDRENELCTGGMDFSPCFHHGRRVTANWAQECATENHTAWDLGYSWTTLPWKAVEGRLRGTETSEADEILCAFYTKQHPSPLILLCSKEKNSFLEPGTGKDVWRGKKNFQELSLDVIFLQISAHAALDVEQGQAWSLCTPTQGSQWVSGSSEVPQGSYSGAAWGTAHKPVAQVPGALEKPMQPILGEVCHQVKHQKLGGGNQKPPNMQCHKPKYFTSNMPTDFSLLHWAAGWIYRSDFYNLPIKKLLDLFHWGFIHSVILPWFFLFSSLKTW